MKSHVEGNKSVYNDSEINSHLFELIELAADLEDTGRFGEASKFYENAYKICGEARPVVVLSYGEVNIMLKLIYSLIYSDQNDRALDFIQKFEKRYGKDNLLLSPKAMIFKNKNDLTKAHKCYKKLIKLHEHEVKYYIDEADLYFENGSIKKAVKVLLDGHANLKKKNIDGKLNIASKLLDMKQPDEAFKILYKITKLASKRTSDKFYYEKARYHISKDQEEMALRCLDRALLINKNNSEAFRLKLKLQKEEVTGSCANYEREMHKIVF